VDFVEICNVCARKAIIKAAKRIRYVIDIVFSILASLFMEHSVKGVFDCLFIAVMFLDLLFVFPMCTSKI